MIKSSQPPIGNTGAVNTSREGLRACVDWLNVTFKNVQLVHIFELIGLDKLSFRESKTGGKGYLKCMRLGGISVYYEGRDNMGIHVEFSGQGCRYFETHSTHTWLDFFSVILLLDINITRLDLAIDDFKGYFTIKQVKDKIRRHCVRSRFKDATEIKKTRLNSGEVRGETIYFGSPQSQIQVRFYNKYLEREEKGFKIQDHIDFWLRTEIQLRDERALSAVILLVSSIEDVGKLASGILKNYINFLILDKDKNKSRWKVCKWWTSYLGDVEKLQLSIVAPDVTIERSYRWLDNQVETTLAMMYEAFNHDMTVFYDLINRGMAKMEDKHKEVVERFKEQHQDITYEEFLKKIKRTSTLND